MYRLQAKQKKNVETDIVGDKIGRIHLGRQDLNELQTRKMKGLKRDRDVYPQENGAKEKEDVVSEDEGNVGKNMGLKRPRLT